MFEDYIKDKVMKLFMGNGDCMRLAEKGNAEVYTFYDVEVPVVVVEAKPVK